MQPWRHAAGLVADAIEARKKRRQRAKDHSWIRCDARFEHDGTVAAVDHANTPLRRSNFSRDSARNSQGIFGDGKAFD